MLFDILLNLRRRDTKTKSRVMACIDSGNYDSTARGGMYITTGRFGGKVTVRVDKLGVGGGCQQRKPDGPFLSSFSIGLL